MKICHDANCLNKDEKEAIRNAKASTSKEELLRVKHMAERSIPVEGNNKNSFWFFYLPDFTNIFKDWYGKYIDGIIETYETGAQACIHMDDDYLLLKYSGLRPKEVVKRKILSNPNYVYSLIDKAETAQLDCESELRKFGGSSRHHYGDLKNLVEKVTNFASYGLDTVFPESLMLERFPFINLSELYYSRISSWTQLREKGIDYLESIYVGEKSYNLAINEYAEKVSYMRWGDIESKENDAKFTRTLFASLSTNFPDYGAIYNYKKNNEENNHLFSRSLKYNTYVHEVSKNICDKDKKLFDSLLFFAHHAIEYNERRRMYFTRGFKLIRNFCEENDVNWRTVSLNELIKNH